ncbi:MAG: flippase-like domain-containing protein [Magnetovibrio sp.]|nr:flippase-like domain-containing protein [Magnetovibrio sp.]
MNILSLLRRYGGWGVSAVAIFTLAYIIDWHDFVQALQQANWILVLIAALFVTLAYTTFVYRWQYLISHISPVSYPQSFRNLMIGHMFNMVLPLRAGDLYRINFIRKLPGWNGGRAVATLLFERIADIATLSLVGLVLIAQIDLPKEMTVTLGILMALIFIFAAMTIVLGRFKRLVRYWAYRIGSWFSPKLARMLYRQTKHYIEASAIFYRANHFEGGLFFKTALISACAWSLNIIGIYFCLMAFNLIPTVLPALSVTVLTNFGLAIPSSPGAIGVFHGLAIFALSPWQVELNLAIAISIILHAISLLPLVLMGLGATLIKQK